MTAASVRLAAALSGEAADSIPVFCNLIDQGAREAGVSLEDYYANGTLVAESQLRLRERFGHDNLWSLFYVGKEAELLGCRHVVFASDGPPNVAHFVIEDASDIRALTVPDDLRDHPAFEQPLACLRLLAREAGGRYPICAYISSTMTLPALLMGMEKWLELLLLGPFGERDALLEKCHEFFVKEAATYREAGADVILYSNPFGSTDTVPMKFFLAQSLPWIERDIRAIGTEGVVYYCGMSRLGPVIPTVVERTGLGAYYLSPMDDVAAGKRAVAGRGLTCGVINDAPLIDWTPEAVRERVRVIIDQGRAGGRFLFGTGVMPLGIPEDNIRALVDAAREFGSPGVAAPC
jgi:uroporphyrinogen-III decarboxylase